MRSWIQAMFVCGVMGAASPAMAALTNGNRPFTNFKVGGEASLQAAFDSITEAGSPTKVDVKNGQTSEAAFKVNTGAQSVATFFIEMTGNKNTLEFGIYDYAAAAKKAKVFGGPDTVGDTATLEFLGNGDVKVDGVVVGNGFSPYFGFYIHIPAAAGTTGAGTTWYTEDDRNSDFNTASKGIHALVYEGDGTTVFKPAYGGTFGDGDFIIAWEDYTDRDFQDAVFLVNQLERASNFIPEPTTAVLGLMSTGALALVRRRRA